LILPVLHGPKLASYGFGCVAFRSQFPAEFFPYTLQLPLLLSLSASQDLQSFIHLAPELLFGLK